MSARSPHAGSEAPLVTVAILAFNRREELAVNLTKLFTALDHPLDRLEVIVVDNASTDGTAEMVRERFPAVQLIVTAQNEGVVGWNRAFAAGRGDWFLVLDDDCYLDGDGLTRALAAAEEHRADLVSFRVASSEPDRFFTDQYPTGVLSFWGCSALVSRRAIDALGGFDPEIFLFAHELPFTMRLLDRGMAHLVLPDVTSVHLKPLPPVSLNYHLNMRHFAYVAVKHLPVRDAVLVLGSLLVRCLAESAANPVLLRIGMPNVVVGARAGLRHRERPIRRAVARRYRRDFVEFTSYVRFVRTPLQRWRDRRSPVPPFPRRRLFWERRPELYPVDRLTAFRVP